LGDEDYYKTGGSAFAGTPGGNTEFGNNAAQGVFMAMGGSVGGNGYQLSNYNSIVAGGAGGSGQCWIVPSLIIPGSRGDPGFKMSTGFGSVEYSGYGGSSFIGNGGGPYVAYIMPNTKPPACTEYGGGGSGSRSQTVSKGGDGGAGVCILTEFLC
jgi:hypothetical protein